MISFLNDFLPIIVYILLIILLIVGIILGIRTIQTIDKVDKVVDDVNDKVQSLNGFFNIIDFTTDKVVSMTDKIVDAVGGFLGSIFRSKKNDDNEEER